MRRQSEHLQAKSSLTSTLKVNAKSSTSTTRHADWLILKRRRLVELIPPSKPVSVIQIRVHVLVLLKHVLVPIAERALSGEYRELITRYAIVMARLRTVHAKRDIVLVHHVRRPAFPKLMAVKRQNAPAEEMTEIVLVPKVNALAKTAPSKTTIWMVDRHSAGFS